MPAESRESESESAVERFWMGPGAKISWSDRKEMDAANRDRGMENSGIFSRTGCQVSS